MTVRRATARALVALLGLSAVPACGGSDGGTYRLVATFPSAIGLYEQGDVVVMGIGVGTVDDIEIEDTGVRVSMTIDDDVPLPDFVEAAIEPLTLIGERNVHLFPAWTDAMADDGTERAVDGDEIPLSRTHVPVEPDEGLQAFNDLAQSLEPDVVNQLITDSATALDGQGARIGQAIDQADALSDLFAGLDTQLVDAAGSLEAVVSTLDTRDAQLRTLVDQFSQATGVLAAERDAIGTFLSSLVDLTAQGESILDLYADELPTDIAHLTSLLLVLDEQGDAIDQLIAAFPSITATLRDAYQPSIDGFNLVTSASPSIDALYRNMLESLGLLVPGSS
jgi:phospholipid/cholesterol/gamma-HCH transport system substrate-binding protein